MAFEIKRVALYARFSSDNQRTESIDAQIRAMRKYCQQNHWKIVAEYKDEAKSATTDKRPEFQKMIEDSGKNLFDIVLVHKLDRFSRNRYDSAIYKSKLKKNNVSIASVLERIDDSPESVMMEAMLEGMAEYYSKNLSREVMKGMNETALQCKHTGGCTPFGYCLDENRKLKIIPEEAKAVKMIFEMFANGYGYTAIIKELNKQGFKTRRGSEFGKNSLFEILRNEKYTGTFVFNKVDSKDCNGRRNGNRLKSDDKVIRIENGCPQIISKELFDSVQKRKEDNKRNAGQYHSREFYIMTGKIFCGVCGKRMQGNLRFSGRNKSRLATYRCNTLRIHCNNKEVNKDYLDEYIVKLIVNKILNTKALKSAVNKLNKYINTYNAEYEDNSTILKNEFSEICESLENITKAIEKGIINDSIITRASELEERKTQLEIQLSEMHQYDEMQYDDFEYLLKEYKNLESGTEEYRTFLQQFINKIIVYPYELEIELNTGLSIANDLKEIVTIRRGELYGMFESRVTEKKNLRYI